MLFCIFVVSDSRFSGVISDHSSRIIHSVLPSRIRGFYTRNQMFVLCLISHAAEIVSYLHYNVYSNIQQTGGTATFQPHFTNKSKWSVFPWSYFLLITLRIGSQRRRVASSSARFLSRWETTFCCVVKTLIHNDDEKRFDGRT